jgi:hypothetical protein
MLDRKAVEQAIGEAIQQVARFLSNDSALRREARRHTLDSWRTRLRWRVGTVGGLAGLPGGPIAVLCEGMDLVYLIRTCGRGCFGIGQIMKQRPVDYDNDLLLILALWSGAATAGMALIAGKAAIKLGSPVLVTAGAKAAGAAIGGTVAKVSLKLGTKTAAAILSSVATKLITKAATKIGMKTIPFIGGVAGAAINIWVLNGLLDVAEDYYSNDYLILGDDLAQAMAQGVSP